LVVEDARTANVAAGWASNPVNVAEEECNFEVAGNVISRKRTGEMPVPDKTSSGVSGTVFTLGLAAQMRTIPRQKHRPCGRAVLAETPRPHFMLLAGERKPAVSEPAAQNRFSTEIGKEIKESI
jgi:hypothetical protein